ncbi:hypothetical protein M422DRAFT_42630 [Sphaerobolus stellatus SS14]|nr:hypothetical protein M422DRAFT_42630 [Sphaerobolus stellatus SS14]
MPRTTAPSTNPRILSGYTPYTSLNSKSGGGPASTPEGRRQLLLNDPLARDVGPEEVTCTRCTKSVRLQKGKQFHLAHWLDHRWRCDRTDSDPQPRARCRTLSERRAILEADPDAMLVEAERVVCGKCNKEIRLRKGRAYGLSAWTQHKLGCGNSQLQTPTNSGFSSRSSTPPTEIRRLPTIDSLTARLDSGILDARRPELGIQYYKSTNTLTPMEPRFFRAGSHLDSASVYVSDSSDTEEVPSGDMYHRAHKPSTLYNERAYQAFEPFHANNNTMSRSASPPALSFSTTTSAATSAVNSPMGSPQLRRNAPATLFSHSRHLPFPELPPIVGLSRLSINKDRDAEEMHKASALGLQVSPGSSRLPSPQLQDSRSTSAKGAQPPPYLERTPLSLPVPEGYWRF